jgi:hypothetical protein
MHLRFGAREECSGSPGRLVDKLKKQIVVMTVQTVPTASSLLV